MKFYALALLIVSAFVTAAHAQSWGDQQKAYHDNLNNEVELFHQREDMERMRQQNERAMQEQQREIEQQRYELENMRSDEDRPYYRY